jgi:hypothetical protein
MKQIPCLAFAVLLSLGAGVLPAAEEQQVPLKLAKIAPLPENLPAGTLETLKKKRERLETWRAGIKKKVEEFNNLGPVQSGSAAESLRRRDLEKLASETAALSNAVKTFNAEVEILSGTLPASAPAMASDTRRWSAGETQKVTACLQAFKDTELKAWVEHQAPRDRVAGTPSSLPPAASDMISANGTRLTFKDGFFDPRATDTKRENLLAFEAGKVLWAARITSQVGQGRSLENWFTDYLHSHPGLDAELKATPHRGEALTDLGDLADPQSRFAHVFRATALGLGSPQRQSELTQFKNAIAPLLKK